MNKATFSITGVDCPTCANKLEKKLLNVKGVTEVTISFLTNKLFIESNKNIDKSMIAEIQAIATRANTEVSFIN